MCISSQGERGAKGDQGHKGRRGPSGLRGTAGPLGPVGATGDIVRSLVNSLKAFFIVIHDRVVLVNLELMENLVVLEQL